MNENCMQFAILSLTTFSLMKIINYPWKFIILSDHTVISLLQSFNESCCIKTTPRQMHQWLFHWKCSSQMWCMLDAWTSMGTRYLFPEKATRRYRILIAGLHWGDRNETLTMQGACSGCLSSSVTLKSGIETMLMHYTSEVKVDAPRTPPDQNEDVGLQEFANLVSLFRTWLISRAILRFWKNKRDVGIHILALISKLTVSQAVTQCWSRVRYGSLKS